MKGTVRFVAGLLITMGAVGGMDMDTATLTQSMTLAVFGLALMAWAAVDMNRERKDA